jgi:2'-hydroxyisoflavone reductase
VRRAAEAPAATTAHAVFVSTGNVYADHSDKGTTESAPLLSPLNVDEMPDMSAYGAAKVACEEHVVAAFGSERVTIARAGLIGGPGDVSDRSGYWPWRFANPAAADGRVLAPDAPRATAQVVDVRDLAAWLLPAATRRIAGAFNTSGETLPLAEHLSVARKIARHQAK